MKPPHGTLVDKTCHKPSDSLKSLQPCSSPLRLVTSGLEAKSVIRFRTDQERGKGRKGDKDATRWKGQGQQDSKLEMSPCQKAYPARIPESVRQD